MLKLYSKYHTRKEYTSIGLFREIKKKFDPQKVLYPGSYVHITPSLIFSDVTYVDSFKNTDKFYKSLEVRKYIDKNKEYKDEPKFFFYHQNYAKPLPLKLRSFDLVISQFAGFVGQDVKKYLRKGGILVCNDSHGDASMAFLDKDYELIAVYERKSDDRFVISDKDLGECFIPKRKIKITKTLINESMKGMAYTRSPSGYIFKKK